TLRQRLTVLGRASAVLIFSPSGAFGQVPNACSQIDRRAQSKRNDTRIFSPLAVAELCVIIDRYWYLFKRLTAVSAGRFYRSEHIVSYSSGKVVHSHHLHCRHVCHQRKYYLQIIRSQSTQDLCGVP